jgi:hypothetical protein
MSNVEMYELPVIEKSNLKAIDVLNLVAPNCNNMTTNGCTYSSRILTITPEIAKILLNFNVKNRLVRPSHVNFLVKEILNGNWVFTGDPIRFDNLGNLIDGQHRLNAIVKSNKPQEMLVQYGLNSEVFTRIDTGKKRSSSDVFSIEDVPNATVAASLSRNLLNFKKGVFCETGTKSSFSNTELLQYYLENPHLEQKVSEAVSLYKKSNRLLEPSVMATTFACISDINEEKAKDFMLKLCFGNGLELKDPILVLRNMIIKAKVEKKSFTHKHLYSLIFYTWELYLSGKLVRFKEIRLPEDFKINF